MKIPTTKNLIQKILPADFSEKETHLTEDFNQGFNRFDILCKKIRSDNLISAWEQVYIHVYKLKDSDLGFYHTGIELYGAEFTYCQVKYCINTFVIWVVGVCPFRWIDTQT